MKGVEEVVVVEGMGVDEGSSEVVVGMEVVVGIWVSEEGGSWEGGGRRAAVLRVSDSCCMTMAWT